MDQKSLENYNNGVPKVKRILSWFSRSLTVDGLENILEGPGIIVANHFNWKDIFALLAGSERPLSFVCQEELLDEKKFADAIVDVSSETVSCWGRLVYPVIRSVSNYVVRHTKSFEGGLIQVSCKNNNKKFLEDAYEKLAQGDIITIFPETRMKKNKHTRIMPFKPGFARIAHYASQNGIQVPVYPTAIRNSMGLWKNIEWVIGEPYYLTADEQKDPREEISEFIGTLEQEVNTLLYKK